MVMHKPYRITFTGADPSCPLDDLIALLVTEPRLELAFLYSETRQGSGRYPPARWIAEAISRIERSVGTGRAALHICGRARRRFLERDVLDPNLGSLERFARIQVNGKLGWPEAKALLAIMELRPEQPIITQYEQSAVSMLSVLPPIGGPYQVLFDASGGRGIERACWPPPLSGRTCGYAGGLGPDNLARELPRIAAAATGEPYWIDMEGKLRDGEDRFSVAFARAALGHIEQAESLLSPSRVA